MSKEIAISKKDKALAVKSMSSFELAVCERKAVLQDLKTEIETAPKITLSNGESKEISAKGWQLKISNKIIECFGITCKDIDKIQDVFLSNTVRAIRLECTELWKRFKQAGDFSELAYNKLKKKADALIESAKRIHDRRMEELEV